MNSLENNTKNEILDYFKKKAKDYDMVDSQCYWRLSDMILMDLFKKKILDLLQQKEKQIRFLDAGGGTGRWSIHILKNYHNAIGTIIDFSEFMLAEAKNKLTSMNLDSRASIFSADLDQLSSKQFHDFNLAFSFHNVIGFVKDPLGLIKKMSDAVNPGGYVMVLAPNLFHSVFFNINSNQLDFSENAIKHNKSQFTKDMPSMHMFTPAMLRDYFKQAGLEDIFVSGFPSSIYPQMQETQLTGSTQALRNLLQDEERFNKILEIEKILIDYPDIASRGNQLVVIGKKA